MAASLKRLEDEIADDESTSKDNGPESELPEDVHTSSVASASITRSDDEEKKTLVPKKKSNKNAELPENVHASSALPTSSNIEENSTSGIELKSIWETSKGNDDTKSECNECPICLEPIVFPIRTPCGHIFCFTCIKRAAWQANRCPMCYQYLPIDFCRNPIIFVRKLVENGNQLSYELQNDL